MKSCQTCQYWITYINQNENLCYCSQRSRGFTEVFTCSKDFCGSWYKRQKLNLSSLLKALDKHHKNYPQTEDLY